MCDQELDCDAASWAVDNPNKTCTLTTDNPPGHARQLSGNQVDGCVCECEDGYGESGSDMCGAPVACTAADVPGGACDAVNGTLDGDRVVGCSCVCAAGWQGDDCTEQDHTACTTDAFNNPCQHSTSVDGHHHDVPNPTACVKCTGPGTTGLETSADECTGKGGTWHPAGAGGDLCDCSCICDDGYEGSDCGTATPCTDADVDNGGGCRHGGTPTGTIPGSDPATGCICNCQNAGGWSGPFCNSGCTANDVRGGVCDSVHGMVDGNPGHCICRCTDNYRCL